MRNNNSSLVNSLDGYQGKHTKIIGQERKTFQAFYSQPKTMLMVSVETGIERANICRLIAKWRKEDKIYFIQKGICQITKHRAGYYTTNKDLLNQKSRQS